MNFHSHATRRRGLKALSAIAVAALGGFSLPALAQNWPEKPVRLIVNFAPGGAADAVAFGRVFIANPDLPARFAQGAPLNPLVAQTIYSPDATGYNDYPTLDAALAQV